jgi:hypothetical protein
MTRTLILKGSILATLMTAGLMGLPPAARGETDDGPCSNRTLNGAYGFSVEGMLFESANQRTSVFRAVALTTFDGKGGLTQVDHYVVNGSPQTPPGDPWPSSKGTYKVNPNCTGSLTLNVPNFPPFVSYFVVVNHGQEIRTVLDTNLVSSVGTKIE